MKSWGKFSIQIVKGRKDLVKTVIDVHYRTLNFQVLLGSEITHGHIMRTGLFGMMCIQNTCCLERDATQG